MQGHGLAIQTVSVGNTVGSLLFRAVDTGKADHRRIFDMIDFDEARPEVGMIGQVDGGEAKGDGGDNA